MACECWQEGSAIFIYMNNSVPRRIWFDIETGSECDAVLRDFYSPPESFSPEACKSKYAAAREEGGKGEEFIAAKNVVHAKKAVEHWEHYRERAALSALTAKVLAIGLREDGRNIIWTADDDPAGEVGLLRAFLNFLHEAQRESAIIEGFNIFGFDLPLLFRRMAKYRLTTTALRRGRYWHPCFRDIRSEWQCGDYNDFISLGTLAKFLGTVHGKEGDGKDFATLYYADRPRALEYLANDLSLTQEVGEAIISDPPESGPAKWAA